MKRLVVLASLAAVLVGASACTNSTQGQASATNTTTETQSGGTSSTPDGGSALPVDHACSLLSSSDLQQFGVSTQPTQEMVGTAHACDFASADFSFGVDIRTNAGLSDLVQTNDGHITDMPIGRHQAKQEAEGTDTCVIAIGVSDKSRVDATVTSGGGSQDPCPTAVKLANILEPKLP